MKRLLPRPYLALAFLFASAVGLAASVNVVAAESQAATRADPNSDEPTASEKVKLAGVSKLRVSICTCTTSSCAAIAPNQTLDGGYVDIWYEHPTLGRWIPNPDLHLPISQPTPASPCRTWADIPSPGGNHQGSAVAVANGVYVNAPDGGNHFRVVLEGINQ